MYAPSHFDETRPDVLRALVADHPLGTLVLQGPAGLDADHLPFELSAPADDAPFGVLRGHVARANPVWRLAGQQALVVFQGPSAYISPSLYEEKQASGKVVPTYNYAVVHAHGTLHAIDDPAWLLAFLDQLTQRHESARAAPWSVHDAPRDYIDKLLGAIVGIEIRVERMQGKWKTSQNRPHQDRVNIAAESGAMAALVRAQR
ncbi:MAG TPA: FMN-binding negative transcriptional regulator [Telluria sp.]|nr:FMN-binding negative transcriptional regulator [Telluria sp.]